MIRLNVYCPRCGAAPRFDVSQEMAECLGAMRAQAVAMRVECHRGICRHRYEILAFAFQEAAKLTPHST